MKKVLVILFLGFLFSCQEAIEPEVIVEEVSSAGITEEAEVTGEIEIRLECEIEDVIIEELVCEEVVEEAREQIEVKLSVQVEEIQEVEIEINETPRKN